MGYYTAYLDTKDDNRYVESFTSDTYDKAKKQAEDYIQENHLNPSDYKISVEDTTDKFCDFGNDDFEEDDEDYEDEYYD